jgi:hypothetical protein
MLLIMKYKRIIFRIIFFGLIMPGLVCMGACTQKKQQKEKETDSTKETRTIKIPKNPKILLFQYSNEINGGMDFGKYYEELYDTDTYNKTYPDTLKKYLGIDLEIISPRELIEGMENIPEAEAEKVADRWIKEAVAVYEVEKEAIIKVARMYLSVNNLLKKYNGTAWTLASWKRAAPDSTGCMPPLAEMQSYLDGIPTCCEGLMDVLVSQMIGSYISDRPGFIGDALSFKMFKLKEGFEHPEDVIIIGHCYMPVNPHGNDRVPYSIRSHVYGNPNATVTQKRDPRGPYVANWTHWPVGEPVTLLRFNVYEKDMSVFTGVIVDGDFYYQDFEETMCRDKLVVKVDNYDSGNCYMFPITEGGSPWRRLGKWGAHRIAFCGNYKEEIIKLAEIIGFDVNTAEGVIKNTERKLKEGENIGEVISNNILN